MTDPQDYGCHIRAPGSPRVSSSTQKGQIGLSVRSLHIALAPVCVTTPVSWMKFSAPTPPSLGFLPQVVPLSSLTPASISLRMPPGVNQISMDSI